jgi:hypothetical protein
MTQGVRNVTSEGRLRVGGAQDAECTRQYMSLMLIAAACKHASRSTDRAQDAERSSS